MARAVQKDSVGSNHSHTEHYIVAKARVRCWPTGQERGGRTGWRRKEERKTARAAGMQHSMSAAPVTRYHPQHRAKPPAACPYNYGHRAGLQASCSSFRLSAVGGDSLRGGVAASCVWWNRGPIAGHARHTCTVQQSHTGERLGLRPGAPVCARRRAPRQTRVLRNRDRLRIGGRAGVHGGAQE